MHVALASPAVAVHQLNLRQVFPLVVIPVINIQNDKRPLVVGAPKVRTDKAGRGSKRGRIGVTFVGNGAFDSLVHRPHRLCQAGVNGHACAYNLPSRGKLDGRKHSTCGNAFHMLVRLHVLERQVMGIYLRSELFHVICKVRYRVFKLIVGSAGVIPAAYCAPHFRTVPRD